MNKDPELFEKLITYLNDIYEDYVYSREDFQLVKEEEGTIVKNWKLDVEIPSYEILEKVKPVKIVEKDSLEDIIKRLKVLEKLNGL